MQVEVLAGHRHQFTHFIHIDKGRRAAAPMQLIDFTTWIKQFRLQFNFFI